MAKVRTSKTNIKALEYTAEQASNLYLGPGFIIYVTTTNATFTSIGGWFCENGGWIKL